MNKITLEEYNKRIKNDEPSFRSCWNCNSAHKHLKNANYLIYCLWCGKMYLKGKQVVVVGEKENE